MLMSVSAFANCYLYVDPEVNLEDLKGQGEQIISLKAHFDVYCSAWQLRFDIPTGVKITYAEPGTDMKVPYVNARGKNATVDVALANNDTYTEFLAAIMVGGYWQDPNGEDPTAWVTYGVVKWEPGDYENMVDLYVEVDDTYEGGDLVVWTTPSSGTDTRGATTKDNGDEAREQTVPEDQPVEYRQKRKRALSQDSFLNLCHVAARNGEGLMAMANNELHGARLGNKLLHLAEIDQKGTMTTNYHRISTEVVLNLLGGGT